MSPTAYSPESKATPRILVAGGGDVGSAVAHGLFRLGAHVVIAERSRSPHARRGMAYTDALFDGTARLEGIDAHRVADAAAVDACWQAGQGIPVVTLPEKLLTAEIAFDVFIDATMRRETPRADLRGMAPCAIGLGPGYVPGINCHIAIETQWGMAMGEVLHDRPTAARTGGPKDLDGVTRERFLVAPAGGLWRTGARIGDQVQAGDVLGQIGDTKMHAPIAGWLRGLTRDGVEVTKDQRLAEVDPRESPEFEGLGERPRAIARGVIEALGAMLPPAAGHS